MHTEMVQTHRTCHQACVWCNARRADDDPAYVQTSAVLARVDAALAKRADRIILSGGEPGMRTDLMQVIARAHAGGRVQVLLETNATLFDEARVREAKAAGLSHVRVNMSLPDEALDALTGDPGGSARAWTGLRAFVAAGLHVEVSVAIVQATREGVLRMPAALAEAGLRSGVASILVRVPTDAPRPDVCCRPEQAAETIVALAEAAQAAQIPLALDPDFVPPPCVFTHAFGISHLYRMSRTRRNRSGFSQMPVCKTCMMNDRCPGFAQSTIKRGLPRSIQPVRNDPLRRRLSMTRDLAAQVDLEFAQTSFLRPSDGGLPDGSYERLIRINFHCNQACRFCFVHTNLPSVDDARIRAEIADAAEKGHRIVLTGGEPTLNPLLPEYVALAKALSGGPIWLQTNATRLDDLDLCQALVTAGVGSATVSLHAADAALSDAITAAPGTFVRTIAGLDNLYRLGVFFVVHFVFTARNVHALPDVTRMVATRWPNAVMNVGFVVQGTEIVPRDTDTMPRWADVRESIDEAWKIAKAAGLKISGVDDKTGIPVCALPSAVVEALPLSVMPEDAGGSDFVRPAPCQSCGMRQRCFGVRRGYVELYGTDELRPFAEP